MTEDEDPGLRHARTTSFLNAGIPVSVVVRNLCYSLTSGRGKKKTTVEILKGIDMCVKSGQLMAILGPSGSGKTTLLNALAQRLTSSSGRLSGDILYNGVPDRHNAKYFSNYVMQRDHLLEFLTVEETLNICAKFSLKHSPKSAREERVNDLLRDLSLESCRKTLVGGENKKGLSGGQIKRLAIGIEMLDNPALLFLDEPTSGLDSSLAFDIVALLAELAHSGRSVICTIHQPRSQMFNMFDKILLLSEGEVVFHGSTEEALPHFESMGYVCPKTFNPADFLLDAISPDASEGESATAASEPPDQGPETQVEMVEAIKHEQGDARVAPSKKQIAALSESFGASAYGAQLNAEIEETLAVAVAYGFEGYIDRYVKAKKSTFCDSLRAVGILLHRDLINTSRNPMKGFPSVVVNVIFGLVVGGVFFQLDTGGTDEGEILGNARDISGALFFLTANLCFGVFDALLSFPHERALMNREVANGWYTCFTFFLGKNLAEFPFQMFPALLQGIIFYLLLGIYHSFENAMLFFLVQSCTTFAACSLAYLVSCGAPTAELANIIAPLANVLFMIVSGFYVDDGSIAAWIDWLKHISHTRYAFFGFVHVIFAPGKMWGEGDEALSSEEIIDYFKYSLDVWICVGALIGLGMGFRVIALLLLRFTNRTIGLEV